MISYHEIQLALRIKLKTLQVVTSGAIEMSVTGSTFSRASGSYLADGFAAGMELTGAGMIDITNNAPAVIRVVRDAAIEVDRALGTESSGVGKTLLVGLPSRRQWENVEFDPKANDPYIEEQLIPGPNSQITVGPGGTVESLPMYNVLVHVPTQVGTGAHNRYADAILNLFPPRLALVAANGDAVRVRADTAPFRGQAINTRQGWFTVTVSIPLRSFTINP